MIKIPTFQDRVMSSSTYVQWLEINNISSTALGIAFRMDGRIGCKDAG